MIKTHIYEKSRYDAPYEWLINYNIQEWDLAKANISILRYMNMINDDDYSRLLETPKQKREVEIGCLRRDHPEVEKAYQKGIVYARQLFFDINNIEQENVLYIDNDSITTVFSWQDTRANYILGELNPFMHFRVKNKYTSLFRLNNIDFLYYQSGQEERYRTKNINQEKIVATHKGYMLDFILSVCYSAQNKPVNETIQLLRDMFNQYTSLTLPLEFYREFNNMNKYKILPTHCATYYADTIKETDKQYLDISYNAQLIRNLYKIFMTNHFRQTKVPRA